MTTPLILVLLCTASGPGPPGAASPHNPPETVPEAVALRMYVEGTTVTDGENLSVVLQIHNGTDGALRLPLGPSLTREPRAPKGLKREEASVIRAIPDSPKQLTLEFVSEVHEQAPLGFNFVEQARVRVPDRDEIAPGETAFLALEVPHSAFAPGDCALSVKLELKGIVVAKTAPVTIRCVGCDEPSRKALAE